MKHTKKLLAILMSTVLLLCSLPLMQASADTTYYESGPWEYTVEDGEATITYFYTEEDLFGKVSVPETLGGYPVTGIEWISCYGSKVDLYIPACITRLTDPEYNEFGNGIVSINVDESNPAFSSENGVLFNKDKTELLAYPMSNTRTAYTIPDSVISIGNEAFYSNDYLEKVTIPLGVTTIGKHAFYVSEVLSDIIIPNTVTAIGKEAFGGCDRLTNVSIPDSVITIGDEAFGGCDTLEVVTIGSGVTTLGERSFRDCYSLKSVTVSESNSCYSSENGILFNKDKTELVVFPTGKNVTSYTIPNSVTIIGTYAFADCLNLKSVTIPNSVETIGEYSFAWCDGLEGITMPDSVKTIEDSAFCGCNNLKNVSLGNGVETIGEDAFYGCDSLTCVTISNSVTSIGNSAFGYCIKLTDIAVDANNQYYSSTNGVLFSKDKTVLIAFPCGKKITSYTVPDGVTTIGERAFYDCESLKNITLPDSLTTIGEHAFDDCYSLKSIIFPDGLTTIGHYAFSDCPLSRVSLPESVKFIGRYAFGWTDITKVYIPAGVEVLDYCAFDGCYNLEYIYYGGSRTQWDNILAESNPDGYYDGNYTVDKVYKYYNYTLETASGSCGTNATWYYDGIDTLTISGTGAMASYPEGKNAPWNDLAYDIETLIIEEGITSIDGFYKLGNIETIVLPESLEYIESCVFCWDWDETKEIIYKGMPEQWENIDFGTHDSDGCLCYDIEAIYIDNEDFSIDSLDIIVNGSTTLKYGETACLHANIPITINDFYKDNPPSDHSSSHDMIYYRYYYLPVGTQLSWYVDNGEYFIGNVLEEYACSMTSENSGTEILTVRLEDKDGWTIYNDDGEPIEASITLTSKVGVIELISYFFRELFNILFGWLMF